MTVQCNHCKELYTEPFIEDFQNGICLPCQAQIWADEWEVDVEKELVIVNAKLGTTYDFNSFCFDCWEAPGKLVTALSESETPILYDVYLRELDNKDEYYAITTQLKLL